MSEEQRLRLDKWLWRARFFKSRGQASVACGSGSVRIDGTPASKAHTMVRAGQVLTFVKDHHVRVIEVLAIPTRRGPAPEAQACYKDLSPPDRANRMPAQRVGKRPTKKDRRRLAEQSIKG